MPHLSISIFSTNVSYPDVSFGGLTMWDFQANEFREIFLNYIPKGDFNSAVDSLSVISFTHSRAIESLSSNIGKVANHLEEHISEPKTDIDVVGEWLKVMSKTPD